MNSTIHASAHKTRVNRMPQLVSETGLKLHAFTHWHDTLPEILKTDEELFGLLRDEAHIDGLIGDFADKVLIWQGRLLR